MNSHTKGKKGSQRDKVVLWITFVEGARLLSEALKTCEGPASYLLFFLTIFIKQ